MVDIETFNEALIECVKKAGGSKVVGPALFPEKPADVAQRQLLACLNEDRPEKLSPDQALLIMRLAKDAGSNLGVEFICSFLHYSIPTPIHPEDKAAALQREFIETGKRMEKLFAQVQVYSKGTPQ